MNTKGPVDSIVVEAGHGYLHHFGDENIAVPPPNEQMLGHVFDFCQEYGLDNQLALIVDDTSKKVSQSEEANKEELVSEYLDRWKSEPDQIGYESESAKVWNEAWEDQQAVAESEITGDKKKVEYTCPALDTAMVAEKLGLTDKTSIPAGGYAVTQHDKNFLIGGEYHSFYDCSTHQESLGIQEQLHEAGVTGIPTFQNSHHLEFNPEEFTKEELEETLYQEVIS